MLFNIKISILFYIMNFILNKFVYEGIYLMNWYHLTTGMENFRKWNLPVKVTQTVYSGM